MALGMASPGLSGLAEIVGDEISGSTFSLGGAAEIGRELKVTRVFRP